MSPIAHRGRGGGRGPRLCLGIRFRREGSSLDSGVALFKTVRSRPFWTA